MLPVSDLFREVLSFCDEAALATLEQLNRASRSFTRDPSLWQGLWGGPLPSRPVLAANTFRGAVLWKRSLLRSPISAGQKAERPIDGFPRHIRMFTMTDMYTVAVAGNTICVWSRANDTLLAEMPLPAFANVSCLDPQDQRVAVGTSIGILIVAKLPSLELVTQTEALRGGITCVKFRPDGRLLVGTDNGVVRVFASSDGPLLQELQAHTTAVARLACAGDAWFSGSRGGIVRVWDSQTNSLRQELALPAITGRRALVHSICSSGNDQLYIAYGRQVLLWHMDRANRDAQHVCTHSRPVKQILVLGKLLFTCTGDWRVRVWDLHTHDCLRYLDNPAGAPITCIAVAEGKLFLSTLFSQSLTELACTN